MQTNYGGILTIMGRPIGEPPDFSDAAGLPQEVGSVMIVLATDAPLDARNLGRLAKRAVLGLARTGSYMSNGSGDFVIAFSTRNRVPYRGDGPTHEATYLRNDAMSLLFLATVEAVEEAVYNSLLKATTVTGRDGNKSEALPVELVRKLLDR